jgi:hypothetical protein
VVEDGDVRRRLECAERGLEDVAAHGVVVTHEGRQHRLAVAPREPCKTDLVLGGHHSLAASLELSESGLGYERPEHGRIAAAPRLRVLELATAVDEIEPANQRRGREQRVERARRRLLALENLLEAIQEPVLGAPQGHLDLLRGHRRHVARLLAVQELGRGLPLTDRDVAEDRDDGGRRHDRQERERREPGGR